MSTPSYLIAHRALPIQAATQAASLWEALSGPSWSLWLAMIGQTLGIEVRHIGVEGAATGAAVIRRDGFELIAMYFPAPAAAGEPYFAIIARREGQAALRSFVFERGIESPVVFAEWRVSGPERFDRIRYDGGGDASLDACLARVLDVLCAPTPIDRSKLLPRLRHARWKGWSELPSRPLLDLPVPGMPRLTAGEDTPETFRFVEDDAALDELLPIAIANLSRRNEFWNVKEKSKGVLGFGAKPTLLELVAEQANARILDARFLALAHEQLRSDMLAVAIPFRGVIWARAAGDDRAFVAHVRQVFVDAPRAVEPVTPLVFSVRDGKLVAAITGDDPAETMPANGFPFPV